MDFSRNKTVMGVVAVLLLLFVASIFFYNRTLNDLAASSCTEDASICPHAKVVETQNLVIAVLVIVIAIMAGWLLYNAYFAKPLEIAPIAPEAKSAPARKRKIASAELDSDEAAVVTIINEAGGTVYQSDILKKTGFSKVKVSRVLDRLEQKGLTERKRRGMTNLVVAR
ncbi:MAG: MarR family transcriptional regulator [Candidatus Micrarchaeota archaeon]|nr:MarR family transcriptional regulator [Candidatus Micrarchaeota archaeon]